jgi:hypothetical protein
MYPCTTNIHGYSIIKGNLGIFGAGYADVGPFSIKDSEIMSLLRKGNEKIKGIEKKIMVTHMHPSNTKIEKMSGFVRGSKSVEKAIKEFQPDIAICGHIHEAAGMEEKIGKTRVINVARKEVIFDI